MIPSPLAVPYSGSSLLEPLVRDGVSPRPFTRGREPGAPLLRPAVAQSEPKAPLPHSRGNKRRTELDFSSIRPPVSEELYAVVQPERAGGRIGEKASSVLVVVAA